MAQEGPSTPERELLKLIEEPTTKGIQTAKFKHNVFSLFSPATLKARISFLKERFKGGIGLERTSYLEISLVNRILEFFIFILAFYLIGNFAISIANLNKKSDLSFEIKKITIPSELPGVSLLKAASYYLEKARSRDIFKMGLSSAAGAQETTSKPPTSKIAEAMQNLKLVGISWSEDPDVIIEDTKVNRAYFLKKGQTINEFKVKAIFRDKVILSYEEEEIELK